MTRATLCSVISGLSGVWIPVFVLVAGIAALLHYKFSPSLGEVAKVMALALPLAWEWSSALSSPIGTPSSIQPRGLESCWFRFLPLPVPSQLSWHGGSLGKADRNLAECGRPSCSG